MNVDQITGRRDIIIDQEELQKLLDEIKRLNKIVEEQKSEINRLYIELDDPHQP